MRTPRLISAAVAGMLCALLTGCGTDDGTDAEEWGTGQVVDASATPTPDAPSESPSGESSAPDTGGSDASDDSVALSSLSAEQKSLHAEMILFEETAKEKAGDGAGGSAGSLRDPDEGIESGVARPEGISIAEDYAISWTGGKIVSYALTSASGERMTYEAGRIHLDVEVDSPRDRKLKQAAEELERAVDEWIGRHGEPPSVSDSTEKMTLSDGYFSDSEVAEVEVPLEGSLSMPEYSRANDDFTVKLKSDKTRENAWLTQDGLTFSRPYVVV